MNTFLNPGDIIQIESSNNLYFINEVYEKSDLKEPFEYIKIGKIINSNGLSILEYAKNNPELDFKIKAIGTYKRRYFMLLFKLYIFGSAVLLWSIHFGGPKGHISIVNKEMHELA
jgi:hypothetical protein